MSKDISEPPSGRGRRAFLGAAGAGLAASFAGCSGVLARESGEVSIAGSSTVFPITAVVASAFRERRDDVVVSISRTGTGGGFSNFFCPGMTDVNNASRGIAPVETEQCGENGISPIEFTVATDALTVVGHPDADWLDSLTLGELRELWREGGAERWSEVRDGWPDEEIEHFGADTTSGTFDYFADAILEEDDTHRTDYHATERDRTIVQGVRGNEYAIGYFGFAYYYENPDQIRAVPVDEGEGPVEPSLETAKSGEYGRLSRSLYIYVSDDSLSRAEVQDFVEFYIEQSATGIVTEVGYVPLSADDRDDNLTKLESAIEEVNE